MTSFWFRLNMFILYHLCRDFWYRSVAICGLARMGESNEYDGRDCGWRRVKIGDRLSAICQSTDSGAT